MAAAATRLRRGVGAVRSHPWCAVAVIVAAVLTTGTAYAFTLGTELRYHDERQFLQLGRNVARSGAYTLDGRHPSAYRPPAWPFVLSLADRADLGVVGMRILGVVLLGAAIVVVFLLARRIGGTDAGLVAAALLGLSPLALYTATTLYPEVFALACLSVAMLAIVEAGLDDHRNRAVAWAALAGGAFAVLALTSPAHAVVLLPATAWLLWRRRGAGGVVATLALVAVFGMGPVLWGARNEARLGSFVPLSTNGGRNLLLGNSGRTTAGSGVDVDLSPYEKAVHDRHLGEVEADDYFRERAIDWIRGHPGRAGVLYLEKLLNFFNFRNQLATGGEGSVLRDALSAFTYYPLLALFVARLALSRRYRLLRGEGLLAIGFLTYAFASAVFFTRLRFRVPVDPLMFVVVACGLTQVGRALSRGPESARRVTA